MPALRAFVRGIVSVSISSACVDQLTRQWPALYIEPKTLDVERYDRLTEKGASEGKSNVQGSTFKGFNQRYKVRLILGKYRVCPSEMLFREMLSRDIHPRARSLLKAGGAILCQARSSSGYRNGETPPQIDLPFLRRTMTAEATCIAGSDQRVRDNRLREPKFHRIRRPEFGRHPGLRMWRQ